MSIDYDKVKESKRPPEPKETLVEKAERIRINLSKDPIEWTGVRDALGLPGLYSPRDVIWTLYSLLKRRYETIDMAGKTFIYDPEVLSRESWKDTSAGPLPDIPDRLKPTQPPLEEPVKEEKKTKRSKPSTL
jgi:hypothetical protein